MSAPPPSRKARQEETRRRLLAAAARVFTAKGFHGASVSAIAAAAGFTTGALYANFASKEALFLALVDEHIAAQRAGADAAADADADAAELRARLGARVAGLASGLTDAEDAADGRLSPLQAQILTLEVLLYAVRERPDLRAAVAERYRAVDVHTTRIAEELLRRSGAAPVVAAADLALAHSWFVEGLSLRLLIDPDLVDPGRAARLYETLLMELPLRAVRSVGD